MCCDLGRISRVRVSSAECALTLSPSPSLQCTPYRYPHYPPPPPPPLPPAPQQLARHLDSRPPHDACHNRPRLVQIRRLLPPPAAKHCAADALDNRSVSCPRWEGRDPLETADYRLRCLYRRQHPRDCSADDVNYWVRQAEFSSIGFGAQIRGLYAGGFAGALRSDR